MMQIVNIVNGTQDSFLKQEIFLSNTILKVMNMRITIMYDNCLIIWNT